MTFNIRKSQIKTIKPNDPRFLINDGLVVSPRAGFELNQKMPHEYRLIIQQCLQNGWLTPVANVTERELLFMGLSKD